MDNKYILLQNLFIISYYVDYVPTNLFSFYQYFIAVTVHLFTLQDDDEDEFPDDDDDWISSVNDEAVMTFEPRSDDRHKVAPPMLMTPLTPLTPKFISETHQWQQTGN